MKTSTELKAELAQLEQKNNTLLEEAKNLEQRLAVVRELIAELSGISKPWGKLGLIERKQNEIALAESREKDELCSLPVWISPPANSNLNLVVSNITKKRIAVKEVGGSTILYSIETGIPIYYRHGYNQSKLDVNATIVTWKANVKKHKK